MNKPGEATTTVAADTAEVPRRTTSVYLPVTLLDELDELADRMERSRTWIVEKAIRAWLDGRTADKQQQ